MAKKAVKSKQKSDLLSSLKSSKKFNAYSGSDTFWNTPMLASGLGPLDNVLGGGFGLGRIGEIYGNYSSGKSYVLYLYLIACQKSDGTAVLIETEGAFNPEWFAMLGGDPSKLVLPECETVEDVFDCLIEIAKYGEKLKKEHPDHKICVGWDGIAATPTKHLMKVGMEKRDMSKSGAMSQGTEYVTQSIKSTNICVIATNQIREMIGSMDSSLHTPGGKSWPFHASQRLELRFNGGSKSSLINGVMADPTGKKVESNLPVGRWITARVEKNKLAPAQRFCNLPYYTEAGQQHPIYGYAVDVGVDKNEALFEFFFNGQFRLPPLEGQNLWEAPKVISSPSQGWYALDSSIDPESKNFRKADWPAVLAAHPQLNELCYQ